MRVRELAVPGCFEFTPTIHRDDRGVFLSPLRQSVFREATGHELVVAQTNHVRSARGVLRGIHFTTTPPGQTKYVHCSRGRALDIAVDLRLDSPSFGRWDAVELDTESFRSVFLPIGVGHAFLALEDDTVMWYLVSTEYDPGLEQAIDPFDPAIGLHLPEDALVLLSERDCAAPRLDEARDRGLLPATAAW